MIRKHRLTAIEIIAVGFLTIILFGGTLLSLPIASREGRLSFFDALFEAVSATCVTGLVVCDTYTQFSNFGQAVLLSLIQVGGLGFMTVACLITFALRRRVSMQGRILLEASVGAESLGGVVRLVRRVLIGTFVIELIGALLLMTRFCPQFGTAHGIWISVFTSVSAFCNAGFDLMGILEPYSSLCAFVGDPVVNLVVMSLILLGGLGFIVWNDVWDKRFHLKKCNLHTKLVLSATCILILLPATLFFLMEGDFSMAGMPTGTRVLSALFQVVTPRTAGFNTVDLATISPGSQLLLVFLMFVGGAPGSTAGGVKLTTVAVILLTLAAFLRGKREAAAFHRRISGALCLKALMTAVFYLMLALSGTLAVVAVQGAPLSDVLVEIFSAIGTVGLSTGLTRELGVVSRMIVMLFMYAGRVGSLAVILSATEQWLVAPVRDPIGHVIVG